jgi:soluble lytic murein transglycosylase-like protein
MMKIFLRLFAIGFGALLATAPAHADCFDEAAKYQKVNPLILRAIAWQESHNQPNAMNKNANGSIDYGLMQINSVHLGQLAQYGISTTMLMQPCKSVYVAAWHLRQKMNKYGNTWQAVGAYHSETPSLRDQYSRQIINILGKWKLLTTASR